MLTFFTTPKAFQGHFEIIQRNAIQSWLKLEPACEIILFGDDDGTAEVAAELGLQHVPEIAHNQYGTPLLNNLFEQAHQLATHNLLCYINADIILMNDFTRAVKQVIQRKNRFLMIGQRWDLDVESPLDFNLEWQLQFRDYTLQYGKPQIPAGMDYFAFSSNIWGEIPPFAIGRTYWDNWLVYQARLKKVPVIDASQVVLAVHQNHPYSHNKVGTGTKESVWTGPEAKHNRQWAGDDSAGFRLKDATHMLTKKGLKLALGFPYLLRRLITLPVFYPKLRSQFKFLLKSSYVMRKRFGLTLHSGGS